MDSIEMSNVNADIIQCVEEIFYELDLEINITNCDIIFIEICKLYRKKHIEGYHVKLINFTKECANNINEEIADYRLFLDNLEILNKYDLNMNDVDEIRQNINMKISIIDEKEMVYRQ